MSERRVGRAFPRSDEHPDLASTDRRRLRAEEVDARENVAGPGIEARERVIRGLPERPVARNLDDGCAGDGSSCRIDSLGRVLNPHRVLSVAHADRPRTHRDRRSGHTVGGGVDLDNLSRPVRRDGDPYAPGPDCNPEDRRVADVNGRDHPIRPRVNSIHDSAATQRQPRRGPDASLPHRDVAFVANGRRADRGYDATSRRVQPRDRPEPRHPHCAVARRKVPRARR